MVNEVTVGVGVLEWLHPATKESRVAERARIGLEDVRIMTPVVSARTQGDFATVLCRRHLAAKRSPSPHDPQRAPVKRDEKQADFCAFVADPTALGKVVRGLH